MLTLLLQHQAHRSLADFSWKWSIRFSRHDLSLSRVEASGNPGAVRLSDVSGCDLLCVPGGLNALDVALDNTFIGKIRRLGGGARYVTSVCTGSLILGAAGLLHGKRAACHWAWRHLLPLFGAIPDEGRVVRDGRVFTGGGVTAGIDFALTVLVEIAGEKVAQTLQLGLEYAPNINPDGETQDFGDRDALHYVVYDLQPLVQAALAAQHRGEDWYYWRTAEGASLEKAVAWLTPYVSGEKMHEEFVHSHVRFDAIRAQAGLKGFTGLFDPHAAAALYWLASRADPALEPLARGLSSKPPLSVSMCGL